MGLLSVFIIANEMYFEKKFNSYNIHIPYDVIVSSDNGVQYISINDYNKVFEKTYDGVNQRINIEEVSKAIDKDNLSVLAYSLYVQINTKLRIGKTCKITIYPCIKIIQWMNKQWVTRDALSWIDYRTITEALPTHLSPIDDALFQVKQMVDFPLKVIKPRQIHVCQMMDGKNKLVFDVQPAIHFPIISMPHVRENVELFSETNINDLLLHGKDCVKNSLFEYSKIGSYADFLKLKSSFDEVALKCVNLSKLPTNYDHKLPENYLTVKDFCTTMKISKQLRKHFGKYISFFVIREMRKKKFNYKIRGSRPDNMRAIKHYFHNCRLIKISNDHKSN